MVNFKNAAPQTILRGIKDESGRPPVLEPELIPSHLPHVFTFAERGPLTPQLVVGDSLVTTYGRKTFDERSRFATHQTPFINVINGEGNSMMVQRLVPEDAGDPATLRLCLDIVPDLIFQYQRNPDNTYYYDENGQKVKVAVSVEGYRARWVLEKVDEGQLLGTATPRAGGLVSQDGTQSTLYPIHEFKVSSQGSYGSRMGIRLFAPTTLSSQPVDDTTAMEQKAYLYRLQFVERPEDMVSPNVIETLFGERYVDFSYKEGTINPRTEKELFVDDVVLQAWNEPASNGYPEVIGPFNEMHVYHQYINDILDMVHAEELPYGTVGETAEDKHIFNLLTGHDLNNVPYFTYQVEGPASDGILLTENSTHYAMGGSDGTMNFETFDRLVANQCANYGDLEYPFLDTAVYPQSVIYDSGFTLETKKKMLTVIGKRKDMYVVLSTQDVSTPQNSTSEESSLAIALRTAARLYPESEIYGTSVCRAIVIGHSGYLVNSRWKKLTPLTLEFAQKCARYMGAGTGIWNSQWAFDLPPLNQVTMFRDVNNTFKPVSVRTRDWANGLVWAQSYDRRSLFFPAFQTVYDDDTSILNSFMNMAIAVELEKVAERVWRDLSGISSLTNAQFIDRSNRLIEQRTRGRFDSRVIIEAETFLTPNDDQRGYSWSCNIIMYGNNMKTVGSFTIISRRREDLEV
jgi:hypothetical protein